MQLVVNLITVLKEVAIIRNPLPFFIVERYYDDRKINRFSRLYDHIYIEAIVK